MKEIFQLLFKSGRFDLEEINSEANSSENYSVINCKINIKDEMVLATRQARFSESIFSRQDNTEKRKVSLDTRINSTDFGTILENIPAKNAKA
jgi:hypothetical protein